MSGRARHSDDIPDGALTSPATREHGYMPQLDALRFFAVMGVIIVHNWQPSAHTLIVGQVDWGDLGVKLFFVLSGFLITGILIGGRELGKREPARRLFFIRQFYIRRFLRIFPVYYAVLLVLILAGVGQIRHIWPWLFTYTTNIYVWHYLAFPYAVPHFWTLAVEEQFYLVWPWAMLFLPRRWLVPFLVTLCGVGPAWRLYASFHYSPHTWNAAYTFTLGVVDFLAIGAILAIAAHADRSGARLRRALAFVVLPIGAVMYAILFGVSHSVDHHAPLALEDTGAALVFCWLIGTASRGFTGPFGRVLGWRPIVYLGKISYGIYIYHYLVPLVFARAAAHLGIAYENSGFPNFIASSLVTFGLATLSWRLFEKPINGLKRHFRYESATEVVPEEPALTPATQAVSP
jgi:peptidoglycan/LPS O-acetylase OafA/YrhL